MKFAIYKTSGRALKKAGAAVTKNGGFYGGFTLIEVMIVIVIVGILSTLAYSSLTDMIFTNRAKEAAQTIRSFTERALLDAKRQNKPVKIYIDGNLIVAEDTVTGNKISEALSQGFSASSMVPLNDGENFNSGTTSQIRIGLSGIIKKGFFVVCDNKGYCGGAEKSPEENSFKARIRRGNNADLEYL